MVKTTRRPAVFLDRDGVLNKCISIDGVIVPPRTLEQFTLLDGALEATRLLRDAGYLLIVVTNQPDVARGTQDRETIDSMHERLRTMMAVEDIFVCPHDDADQCMCRKPQPGMLLQAMERHNIDVTSSFMVGDRWRDISAGRAAGCMTILVGDHEEGPMPDEPAVRLGDLRQAAEWIIKPRSTKIQDSRV